MDISQHDVGAEPGKGVTDSDSDSRQLDMAARAIGLRKRLAYVPAEKNAKTANAVRVERSKARAEARGIKAVTVSLPMEHHHLFKAMAADLRSGSAIEDVLISPSHLENYKTISHDHVSDLVRSLRSLRRSVIDILAAASAVICSLVWRAPRAVRNASRLKKSRRRNSAQ